MLQQVPLASGQIGPWLTRAESSVPAELLSSQVLTDPIGKATLGCLPQDSQLPGGLPGPTVPGTLPSPASYQGQRLHREVGNLGQSLNVM